MGTSFLLSILPLSFVHDSKSCGVFKGVLVIPILPQLLKLDSPKRFGEEVSELVMRGDVVGLDALILQAVP